MKGNIFSKILKSKAVQSTVKFAVTNAPKILTGISIVSSVTATVFAVKGTILAVEIEKQRKAKIESGELPVPEHPKLEVIKSVWKCYIPTVILHGVSIGSALYGVDISTARTAMATAACKASEYAFEEYKEKVSAELGEEKEKEIRQDIARTNAEQGITNQSTLVISPYEKVLFQEMITGQIFTSDVNTVKESFNKINYGLSHGYDDDISVMEYLDEFGIACNDENRGWNVTKTGLLEPRFELSTTNDGRPCLRLYTTEDPYIDYDRYS